MNRAQSYFLVCAVVSKSIAYAIGPRMLSHADSNGRKGDDQESRHDRDGRLNISGTFPYMSSERKSSRLFTHVQHNPKTNSVTLPPHQKINKEKEDKKK